MTVAVSISLLSFILERQSSAAVDVKDSAKSATRFSPGVLIQSLGISRHFRQDKGIDDNYFAKKRDLNHGGERDSSVQLPMSWNAGFGFSRASSGSTTTDSISDLIYTGTLGLNWEDSSPWDFDFLLNLDTIPNEDYRHGAIFLSIGYTFRFGNSFSKKVEKKKTDDDESDDEGQKLSNDNYDSNDAVQYYLRQRDLSRRKLASLKQDVLEADPDFEEGDEENIDKKVRYNEMKYPNLRVSYHLGFSRHMTISKFLRNPTSIAQSVDSQTLDQYQSGPEISYSPNSRMKYGLAVNFYSYSSRVDSYLSTIELGSSARHPIAAVGGWSPYVNQLLSFPLFTVDESASWNINYRDNLTIYLNQTFYASTKQDFTMIFNPTYSRNYGKKWRAGLGAGLILGDSSTLYSVGLELNYKL